MKIEICMGSSCHARGNDEFVIMIQDYLKEQKLEHQIEFVGELCHGLCGKGPILKINGELHTEVNREKLDALFANL